MEKVAGLVSRQPVTSMRRWLLVAKFGGKLSTNFLQTL
jgi:hypothetical protein